MSTNDSYDDATVPLPGGPTPASSGRISPVTRRILMKSAAGVGIAAAAVGAVGVANAASTPHAAAPAAGTANADAGVANSGAISATGAIVIHVTDSHKGTIEVFNGFNRKQITDRDLAARIARAAN